MLKKIFSIVAIFSSYLLVCDGANGLTIIERTYVSSFECMKGKNIKNFALRLYLSNGKTDPNGPFNIRDAVQAGIFGNKIDGFIQPCYNCGDGAKQVYKHMYYE